MFDKDKISGYWRIIEMSQWNQDAVDLVVDGHFVFDSSGQGSFQFICVEGDINYSIGNKLEFGWTGNDEFDTASGHGWVKFKNDDQIHGEIYIHNGDSSTFVANRQNKDDKNNAIVKPIR